MNVFRGVSFKKLKKHVHQRVILSCGEGPGMCPHVGAVYTWDPEARARQHRTYPAQEVSSTQRCRWNGPAEGSSTPYQSPSIWEQPVSVSGPPVPHLRNRTTPCVFLRGN